MILYGVVWYGMVWYGMVWYGMVWYGVVLYGVVWIGIVWYGIVWYDVLWYGMVWYGIMVWYSVVCHGVVWHGVACYGLDGTMWYGTVWYGVLRPSSYGYKTLPILPFPGTTAFSSSGSVTYQNFCGMWVTVLSNDILFIALAKSSLISLQRTWTFSPKLHKNEVKCNDIFCVSTSSKG